MDRFSLSAVLHKGRTLLIGNNDGLKEIPLLIEKDLEDIYGLEAKYDTVVINKVIGNKELLKSTEFKDSSGKLIKLDDSWFINKSYDILNKNGILIVLIYEGYEWDDELKEKKNKEIAGYTRDKLLDLVKGFDIKLLHKADCNMNSGEVYWYVVAKRK